MRKVMVTYYTIEELKEVNPQGYSRAFKRYQDATIENGYNWMDEVMESVKKFLDMFNCELVEFNLDSIEEDFAYNDGYIAVSANGGLYTEELALDELEGEQLKSYLQSEHGEAIKNWENFQLAGYYLDNILLKPFADFMLGGKFEGYNLKELIDLALCEALKEVNRDYTHQLSGSAFEEEATRNEYYFDINGNLE